MEADTVHFFYFCCLTRRVFGCFRSRFDCHSEILDVIWWGGGWRGLNEHGLDWSGRDETIWVYWYRMMMSGDKTISISIELQWFEFCRFFDWPSVCRVLAKYLSVPYLDLRDGLFADFLLFLNNEQRPYIIPCPVCLRSSIYFKNECAALYPIWTLNLISNRVLSVPTPLFQPRFQAIFMILLPLRSDPQSRSNPVLTSNPVIATLCDLNLIICCLIPEEPRSAATRASTICYLVGVIYCSLLLLLQKNK